MEISEADLQQLLIAADHHRQHMETQRTEIVFRISDLKKEEELLCNAINNLENTIRKYK